MPDYRWSPIQELSDTERAIDLASIQPLYETWRQSRARLQESSGASLQRFTERLVRRLSVETGILERLYDLDRGTTEALVAKGFVEDLVSRSSTDIEPSRLIDILKDQEAAIQCVTARGKTPRRARTGRRWRGNGSDRPDFGDFDRCTTRSWAEYGPGRMQHNFCHGLVMDAVAGNRDLTRDLIHNLHAILTRHQNTTMAVDPLGNRHEIPLLKGRFKEQANNPRRPDGAIHEYCPPVQVESEMDNLLDWLSQSSGADPVILATWFHHRFTQIHPYQDGNGRVARTLTTLVLLRADLLPLVIDRDLRSDYIGALESADLGNLEPLTTLFASLERTAILQALSVDADAEISHEKTLTATVIDTLADKIGRRKKQKDEQFRKVDDLAMTLRQRTRGYIEEALNRLKEPVSNIIAQPDIHITDGGPDRANAHWYKFEVVQSAIAAKTFANFDENHYFVKASFRAGRERLIFVTSFHHVGRELSGIMEATAFARLESFEQSDDRDSVSHDFFVCSLEPFVLTYRTVHTDITDSFSRWLDAALAVAVKEYGDRL